VTAREWAELAGIFLTFATAVAGMVQGRRIHVLVNSQLQATLLRVAQLTRTLDDAGVDVPPRPDGKP
jgi:hypothetical protein